MKSPLVSLAEAKKLIKKHGVPLYVYRRSIIEARYKALKKSITYPKARIFYACKANTNPDVLKFLRRLGSCVECVSRGEVERALEAGFPRDRISYTCSNIPQAELAWVMRQGISVQLDSLTQLEWWGRMKPRSRISLRINRGFGAGAHSHIITGGPESKFGIYYTDILKARALAKRYHLTIAGLAQHIGSNILNADTFVRAMRLILASAKHFPDLEYVDFGGGLGIPYRPDTEPLNVAVLGRKLSAEFSDFCRDYGRALEMRLEPGRFLVAEAGGLLAEVVDIKRTPKHVFVGVNSGFNHLIRPAFYGSYHHIFNLSHPKSITVRANIVGNICESGDCFAHDRLIPSPHTGDLLLFADAGAYGYTMSSDYNLRARPKEVLM